MIMSTDEQQGIFTNVAVGIVGALIGGFFAQTAGIGKIIGFNLLSFFIALGGAIILLSVVKMFSRSNH